MDFARKVAFAALAVASIAALGTAPAAASASSTGNAHGLESAAAGAHAATAAAALYSVTDLGTLGTGNLSVANAINNAGVVVGYTDVTPGLPHAFRWTAGKMTDLGVEPGGDDSVANAINDAGQVAGTADRQPGGYGYPVRWSASGTLTDLGGTITNELGVGNAIDPAGRVAGGQRLASSEGSPVAEIYGTDGTATYLGNPPDSLNAATGINAVDQVVGSPAFVWKAGTLTMLPSLAGAPAGDAAATAINISGQIVGSAGVAGTSGGLHAALWSGGTITDLGTVNAIAYNQANAINAAGQIVGTADPRCQPCVNPVAWLREPGGALTDLNTLIPAGSGWTLEQANGINDRGQIVGAGLRNGALHAYVLTPSFAANVNFATSSAPVPAGYVADSGAAYGARGNGLTYGWNIANTTETRQRNSATSPDERYDTLVQMQRPGSATSWQLAVPNGTYLVHLVSGDPSYTDSVYRLDVQGTLAVSGTPSASRHWFEGSVLVTVTNGELVVSNGSGSSNDKVDYIDIIAA
jgi:probable HAF family extracellular repeat protein